MEENIQETLLELLERNRKSFHIQYNDFLSNHMA